MWCRYNQPGPCIMQFHLQVNTLIELVLWLSTMCNKQFTKWKLLLARVIVRGCIYQLTTTDFVTSIQALRISVTFSTCWNALSIGAFELVWCTICLYEIIALATFHNHQKLLACLIKIITLSAFSILAISAKMQRVYIGQVLTGMNPLKDKELTAINYTSSIGAKGAVIEATNPIWWDALSVWASDLVWSAICL